MNKSSTDRDKPLTIEYCNFVSKNPATRPLSNINGVIARKAQNNIKRISTPEILLPRAFAKR
jgi:hypothetical protein